jgi:hypothetical protein
MSQKLKSEIPSRRESLQDPSNFDAAANTVLNKKMSLKGPKEDVSPLKPVPPLERKNTALEIL